MAGGLIGVGAMHVDRIGRVDGVFRRGASNPGPMQEWVGGCMGNVLGAAAGRGRGKIGLISARGGDADGQTVAAVLAARGIADFGAVFLDRATASYTAILDADGEVRAALADMDVYETGLARHLRRSEVHARIGAATHVAVDANLPERAIGTVLDASGRPVTALAVSPAKCGRLKPYLERLDLVIMNTRELRTLAVGGGDEKPATDADRLRALAAMGLRRAVVTNGPKPVLVMAGDRIVSVAVPDAGGPIEDVTGAGDALAGIVIAHATERGLPEAVQLGIAAAGVAIRSSGPFAPELAGRDLDAMIDRQGPIGDLGPV